MVVCVFVNTGTFLIAISAGLQSRDMVSDLWPGKKLLSWKMFLHEAVSGRKKNIASFVR